MKTQFVGAFVRSNATKKELHFFCGVCSPINAGSSSFEPEIIKLKQIEETKELSIYCNSCTKIVLPKQDFRILKKIQKLREKPLDAMTEYLESRGYLVFKSYADLENFSMNCPYLKTVQLTADSFKINRLESLMVSRQKFEAFMKNRFVFIEEAGFYVNHTEGKIFKSDYSYKSTFYSTKNIKECFALLSACKRKSTSEIIKEANLIFIEE